MLLHTFPTVDLREARSGGFPRRVMDALLTQGFIAVKGHRATRELMDEAERLTAELFTRWTPEEIETWFGRPDLFRQRGSTGISVERAAAQPGKERPPADLKQFFMIRDEDVPRNLANMPYGPNIWPNDILPRFRIVMLELMAAYKEIYLTLLTAVERACGLRKGKLTGMAKASETVLRPIFYPGYDRLRAMGINILPGAQRSAPHGDINALTVLRPRPGLWALLNGSWVKADASDPDVIWVNIGEMLAQVEGVEGLVPTIHCVGTPPGMSDPEGDALLLQDRVAIPMFGHFRRRTRLRRGDFQHPVTKRRLKALWVDHWFDQRIREITTG
jgi:isopenicillin N synthase-like dioxygenase